MVDLLTIVFVAAILLRATESSLPIDSAWFNGFFLTTAGTTRNRCKTRYRSFFERLLST